MDIVLMQWRKTKRYIFKDFDRDATEAEHTYRPELWVCGQSDDDF